MLWRIIWRGISPGVAMRYRAIARGQTSRIAIVEKETLIIRFIETHLKTSIAHAGVVNGSYVTKIDRNLLANIK